MNPLGAFASYSATAAAGLVSAIWQGALLALAVGLVLRALPGLSAAARSVIWSAVFLLIAFLHFAPLAAAHGAPGRGDAVHVSLWWAVAIGAAWLLLTAARAAQLAWSALHLRRVVLDAVPVAVGAEIAPLLRVGRRTVAVCASDAVARPCVLGFWQPRILMPKALLAGLSEAELRQVVVHEMEHLHRRDDWMNLVQKLALVAFPLNPALVWVERRLCAERELACDDRVLAAGAGRKAYALCLARLAEFGLLRRGYALVLGAWERRPELLRRVQRILAQPGKTLGRRPALALTGGLVMATLAGGVTLAHAPQLVSFAPAAPAAANVVAQAPAALDRAGLERAMGAKAEPVKAVLGPSPDRKVPARPIPTHAVPARAVSARAVLARSAKPPRRLAPATRLAQLNVPAPQDTLVVMTEWTAGNQEFTQSTVVFQQTQAQPKVRMRQPRATQALYLVPTTDGWLVVKI